MAWKAFRIFLRRHIDPYWKSFVVVLTPILLLPLPILGDNSVSRAGYGVLIMSIYWLTAALPLAVTSLLPLVLFPVMNVMSTSDVCMTYFKEANVVFLAGLILALGVEQSKLHKRIAIRIMLTVGTNPRWLMLGFMSVAMLLSMWISNSGVTAMLIPIVEAVVQELFQESKEGTMENGTSMTSMTNNSTETIISVSKDENLNKSSEHAVTSSNADYMRKIRLPMIMSIAYSASIGGAGTLIGSGSPLAFKGILEELYGTETGLSFATFMAVAVPCAVVNTLLTWIWLQILFMGCNWNNKDLKGLRSKAEVKAAIRHQYEELGPMTFHEKSIMALFSILILLWFFKDPHFIPGWDSLFESQHKVGDATAAIAIVVLAFILPAKPSFWCFNTSEDDPPKPSPSLLDWHYVQNKIPWNVFLVLGGGYTISEASKVSGLSAWLGQQLSVMQVLPPVAIMIILCLLATTLTELAANTAVASILLPVVAQMVQSELIIHQKQMTKICSNLGRNYRNQSSVFHDSCLHIILLCFHVAGWYPVQWNGVFSSKHEVILYYAECIRYGKA